ncbi:MAG TPA: hypothetical protein VEU06_01410 [Micropepsaceae bacterium]|nr:hypothetical protein [Micropepsaceae bacterium]
MGGDELETGIPEPMAVPLYVARARSQARAKLAAEAKERKRVLTRWLVVAFFAGAGISFLANKPDHSLEISGLPMLLTPSNGTEAPRSGQTAVIVRKNEAAGVAALSTPSAIVVAKPAALEQKRLIPPPLPDPQSTENTVFEPPAAPVVREAQPAAPVEAQDSIAPAVTPEPVANAVAEIPAEAPKPVIETPPAAPAATPVVAESKPAEPLAQATPTVAAAPEPPQAVITSAAPDDTKERTAKDADAAKPKRDFFDRVLGFVRLGE